MTSFLEARNVVKRFGGLYAVDDVSFALEARQILGLIGPNGSGKTTLLSLLAGTQQQTSGRVVLAGSDISAKGARATVRAGVARTFQTTRLFPSWTLRRVIRFAQREQSSVAAQRFLEPSGREADNETGKQSRPVRRENAITPTVSPH